MIHKIIFTLCICAFSITGVLVAQTNPIFLPSSLKVLKVTEDQNVALKFLTYDLPNHDQSSLMYLGNSLDSPLYLQDNARTTEAVAAVFMQIETTMRSGEAVACVFDADENNISLSSEVSAVFRTVDYMRIVHYSNGVYTLYHVRQGKG